MTIDRIDPVSPQYSKAVVAGNLVYLAGLIAEDWDKDIIGQSEEIFSQIDDLLEKSGTDKTKLLTVMVYLKTFDDYAAFKDSYASWVATDNLPARATIRAKLLDPKLRVEIMATAAR